MKLSGTKKSSSGKKQSFVMIVGDEGAILAHVTGNQITKRIFAAHPEKEQLKAMDDLLKSAPKIPLLMLVDMMDQSYVRQTLPPVSTFNVGKIVRRRLNKDFANDDIKGYVILGRDKTGRKDWNYLMASLANPPVLQKWIEFAVEHTNPFRGIGLVPLESQPLIVAIETATLAKAGKDTKPTEWHLLVSHHKVGGFRQIVLKNRQIIFTRLAQLVGEPTPEVIAGNIEQEMLNTLEYLKRLGLQGTQGLTATIIASKEIKESFETKVLQASQCHFYTPHELAAMLSVPEFAKTEDHYGDVVISAVISSRRKLLMPLFTTYTRKLAKLGKYIKAMRTGIALIVAGILGWASMMGWDWYNAVNDTADLKSSLASTNAAINKENEKKKSLPEKIDLYSDIATLFRYFYSPTFDPVYFVHPLHGSTENLALVKSYHWNLPSVIPTLKGEDKRQISAEFEAILTSPQEPREAYVANAKKLVEKVKQAYPDYEVTNSDLPGILSESKELKTVISDTGNGAASQTEALSNSVRFTLKGPVKPSSAPNQLPNPNGGH